VRLTVIASSPQAPDLSWKRTSYEVADFAVAASCACGQQPVRAQIAGRRRLAVANDFCLECCDYCVNPVSSRDCEHCVILVTLECCDCEHVGIAATQCLNLQCCARERIGIAAPQCHSLPQCGVSNTDPIAQRHAHAFGHWDSLNHTDAESHRYWLNHSLSNRTVGDTDLLVDQ